MINFKLALKLYLICFIIIISLNLFDFISINKYVKGLLFLAFSYSLYHLFFKK